jgi:hypothetical protein
MKIPSEALLPTILLNSSFRLRLLSFAFIWQLGLATPVNQHHHALKTLSRGIGYLSTTDLVLPDAELKIAFYEGCLVAWREIFRAAKPAAVDPTEGSTTLELVQVMRNYECNSRICSSLITAAQQKDQCANALHGS